ncbi:MAG: hypothetical protein MJ138_04890 [Kiritimatiellae bacterium]|nr:hypothetical protein [Kiritimatiellia bacterium]
MKAFWKKESTIAFCAFAGLFAALAAYVFWGTWGLDATFIQPDNGIVHLPDAVARRFREFAACGTAFVPADLRLLLGGPYAWQELQYAFAAFVAALGVAYYLRGRGVPPALGYGAGMAYGFMGYNFTLFSAGHLGWFNLLACAPWAFGLIDRAVRKGKWRNWALLGAVMAWASAWQPDIWLLFACFWFAYGAYKIWSERVRGKKAWTRLLLGAALAAATMLAVGAPQFRSAFTGALASREAQLAAIGAVNPGDASASDGAAAAEAAEARWNFCVSWSLPPEDVAEFFVAGVHGDSSDPRVSPKNPYKGRIGQRIVLKKGQRGLDPVTGRPVKEGDVVWAPYRQHALYMGGAVVAMALLGVVALFAKWANPMFEIRGNRREAAFWAVAGVVLLFCAFGGFTPFYKLVYHLPYGSSVRCPLKFVHLLEWCVAVLAGFGAVPMLRLGRKGWALAIALFAFAGINLACNDRKYVATDPVDCLRVQVARETGTAGLQLVMDAQTAPDGSDCVFASGQALNGNAALKEALGKGEYAAASGWTFNGKRFARAPRERAQFLLLKKTRPYPPPPEKKRGAPLECALAWISIAGTVGASAGAFSKLRRPRAAKI